MNDQGEHRNKKKDKAKRNRGFPYKRLIIRESELLNGQNKNKKEDR